MDKVRKDYDILKIEILYHKIGNDESQKLCAESPSEASLYHSS